MQPLITSPIPSADMADCETISADESLLIRPAAKAAVGAVKGAALDMALSGVALSGKIATLKVVLPLSLPGFILPMAIYSAADGVLEMIDRKSEILRQCLRDKGHRVY